MTAQKNKVTLYEETFSRNLRANRRGLSLRASNSQADIRRRRVEARCILSAMNIEQTETAQAARKLLTFAQELRLSPEDTAYALGEAMRLAGAIRDLGEAGFKIQSSSD